MAKVGRFWSDEGEAEYRRVYDDARALWPEHEVRRVETRYGEVQTLTVGSGDATPIVLLHGMSCTSLMWRPNVEALAEFVMVEIRLVHQSGIARTTARQVDMRRRDVWQALEATKSTSTIQTESAHE